MTWRCVPVARWHKAPHLAAVAFGVLIAAHPLPAGRAACHCKMVWYPDAPATQDAGTPAPHRLLDIPPAPLLQAPIIVPPARTWADARGPLIPASDASAPAPTPVPEPPTWTTFVAAIAALLLVGRGRRVPAVHWETCA